MYVNYPFCEFLQLGHNVLKPCVSKIFVIQRVGVIFSIYSFFQTGTQPDSKIKSESSESINFIKQSGQK